MNKIFVSTSSFGKYDKQPIEILKNKGLEVLLNPLGRRLNETESVSFLKEAIGLIAGTEILDRNILYSLPSLKVISRCGVGVDNIDVEAAKELGIKIFNTPDAPTLAVAELTLGLMFSLLRHITEADRSLRKGEWKKYMGNLLYGKKIGIVGLGRIGKKVSELLISLGCEVLCCESNPDRSFLKKHKIKELSLGDLLSCSDIVSLHLSRKREGDYLISKEELSLMKKDAFLINTARGNLIDERALVEAVRNKNISGAGIDVYEQEPYAGPLKEMGNVVLTSHIGSYARESRVRMEVETADNLIKGLGLVASNKACKDLKETTEGTEK